MSNKGAEYPLLLDDGDVAALLAQDAAKLRQRYDREGPSAYREPATARVRPTATVNVNSRFLLNTVRDVQGHNDMLKRKERADRLNLENHPLRERILTGRTSKKTARATDARPAPTTEASDSRDSRDYQDRTQQDRRTARTRRRSADANERNADHKRRSASPKARRHQRAA